MFHINYHVNGLTEAVAVLEIELAQFPRFNSPPVKVFRSLNTGAHKSDLPISCFSLTYHISTLILEHSDNSHFCNVISILIH